MTLSEFLLARIAEDEATARAVPLLDYNFDMGGNRQDERWVFDRTLPSSADGMGNWSKHRHSPTTTEHFQRWVPARVLAECEAKRRIVQELQTVVGAAVIPVGTSRPARDGLQSIERGYALTLAIKHLVLPYADHPDWREEWRP